jgi:hypothetical protein
MIKETLVAVPLALGLLFVMPTVAQTPESPFKAMTLPLPSVCAPTAAMIGQLNNRGYSPFMNGMIDPKKSLTFGVNEAGKVAVFVTVSDGPEDTAPVSCLLFQNVEVKMDPDSYSKLLIKFLKERA